MIRIIHDEDPLADGKQSLQQGPTGIENVETVMPLAAANRRSLPAAATALMKGPREIHGRLLLKMEQPVEI
jgi:hypothetical protein